MAITFPSSVCGARSKRERSLVVVFGRCILTERRSIKLPCRFISVPRDRCVATPRMIWCRCRGSRTSRSWKRKRSLATSCRGDCLADPCSRSGSKNTCRRMARRICIPSNLCCPHHTEEQWRLVTSTGARPGRTHYDRRGHSEHQSAETFLRAGSRRGGLLHRPECLHRLQGLRSRLQGMEPGPG